MRYPNRIEIDEPMTKNALKQSLTIHEFVVKKLKI